MTGLFALCCVLYALDNNRFDVSRAVTQLVSHGFSIPTLRDALSRIPSTVPIMLDMKQTPEAPLVDGIAKVLTEEHAWNRVRLYSTSANATALMRVHPEARLFESRDATRERLVQVAINHRCDVPPATGTWVGIELHRRYR